MNFVKEFVISFLRKSIKEFAKEFLEELSTKYLSIRFDRIIEFLKKLRGKY